MREWHQLWPFDFETFTYTCYGRLFFGSHRLTFSTFQPEQGQLPARQATPELAKLVLPEISAGQGQKQDEDIKATFQHQSL